MKPVLHECRGVHRAKEQRHVDHPVIERGSVEERGSGKHRARADRELNKSLHEG